MKSQIEQKRRDLYREWLSSGKSKSDFADWVGMVRTTFYNWTQNLTPRKGHPLSCPSLPRNRKGLPLGIRGRSTGCRQVCLRHAPAQADRQIRQDGDKGSRPKRLGLDNAGLGAVHPAL